MNKLSIRDLDMMGKRVFMRVDFNVPLEGTKITDDTRIRETLPTLQLARGTRRAAGAGVASGAAERANPIRNTAWRRWRRSLAELLGKPVEFAADCVGADAEAKSRALANGGVLLLENVRYHAEEEANDGILAATCGACATDCLFATRLARRIARTPRWWGSRDS